MGKIGLTEKELIKALEMIRPKKTYFLPSNSPGFLFPEKYDFVPGFVTGFDFGFETPGVNAIITNIEYNPPYELNEDAPSEELTPVAKAIWEALWDDYFPDIRVVWGEGSWPGTHGEWFKESNLIKLSFKLGIKEKPPARTFDILNTLIHELLHVRGYEHHSWERVERELSREHQIFDLEVEKLVSKFWELVK